MHAVRSLRLALLCLSSVFSPYTIAQIVRPVVPVSLSGEPRATQVPAYATITAPQCDGSGKVYVQYELPSSDGNAPTLAKIESDGSTKLISLAPLPDPRAQIHLFNFAAAGDSSLYEIMRASAPDLPAEKSSEIDLVRFDSDGSLRSRSPFGQEFIPSLLLPLPDGNFFAAGVTLKQANDGVVETSVAGIFGPDAKLQRSLRDDSGSKAAAGKKPEAPPSSDIVSLGGIARLSDDGNIYILLVGDHAKVAVVTQSGSIARQISLREPFEVSVVDNMWASGNRLLVSYEGEADDPKDSQLFVLYDTQSGEVIRVYRPDFAGTPTCFQQGQTLSVLVPQLSSGNIGIATVDLP